MDRGAWQAIVHGVTRVGQDLVTKPPPPPRKPRYTAVKSLVPRHTARKWQRRTWSPGGLPQHHSSEAGLCMTSTHFLVQLSPFYESVITFQSGNAGSERLKDWFKITHLVKEQGRNIDSALSLPSNYFP